MTRIRVQDLSIYRFAHLSDPHLPPPKGAFGWRDVASKRVLSRIAWRRKHHEHPPEVLAAIIADVKAQKVDHIALTGDLTNFASDAEVEAARAWLTSLGPAASTTVSPGNHDALVPRPGRDRFAPWAPWMSDDEAVTFPRVRVRPGVAFFNLCSAVPTAPHLATGRLGPEQLARLDVALVDPAYLGLFRVVLIHHPPIEGAVSGRKSLEDLAELRAVLKRRGADLVLHGHAHEAMVAATAGPGDTDIPVLGVPSASAAGHGKHPAARWHLFEVEADIIRVIARGLDAAGVPTELGRYTLARSRPS